MAALISVPIGVFAAIYLVEYGAGKRLARTITFLVDVMTGIPSIVAGLFALSLFVIILGPAVRFGFGGAVALSLLMIPTVVRSTEEMLRLVPADLREASYALGVPKWRTVTKVVLPTAVGGIVTGVVLAISRVIGETAPLLVIAGFTDSVNTNLFDGRMMTLPVFIFTQYSHVHREGTELRLGRCAGADRHRHAAQPCRPHHRKGLRSGEGLTALPESREESRTTWPRASTSPTSTSTTATSRRSRGST